MGVFEEKTDKSVPACSDEEQLRFLFDAYFDRLTYFAFNLLKDQDAASDMAQEAFIKYWQVRDQVGRQEMAIKNFLYVTVRNACLNSIRHERVAMEYASRFAGELLVEEAVVESIITAEVMNALQKAISSLPEPYQKISRLAYMEGRKNQEIADELSMSVNTVKKQKQKILELLRLRLAPELLAILVYLYQ